MTAYYNEYDPFAAQWLRNLIAAGHIADGDVDDRSIIDVKPEDLEGYTQCHFFAGLGGWSYALRLAGWPDDRPVWTGSPPCQPFSVAGLQKGKDDERHLAPQWLELVSQCRPAVLFGEQVEAAIRKDWLDDLQDHLEAEDYACAATVLPACSVGAPHIRQRLWFVAERLGDPVDPGLEGLAGDGNHLNQQGRHGSQSNRPAAQASSAGGVGNAQHHGSHELATEAGDVRHGEQGSTKGSDLPGQSERAGVTGDDPVLPGCEGGLEGRLGAGGVPPNNGGPGPDAVHSFWSDADWLSCRDGKWRPVEPGVKPMVDGASQRMGRLRAYGNAIVGQVAAEVIKAYMK